MLLQSHAGEIEILPALPSAWPSGFVKGLRARGAVGVDIRWAPGRATEARLRPDVDGEQVIRPPKGQQVTTITVRGTPIPVQANGDGTVRASLRGGNEYLVGFASINRQ